jgi:hypothetical protein
MQLDEHVRTSVKKFEEEFDFMDDCQTVLKTWDNLKTWDDLKTWDVGWMTKLVTGKCSRFSMHRI